MATVKIYGASDDLVEVEGDVPGCNEFYSIGAPLFIEICCGAGGYIDVFKVEYTRKGVWLVTHTEKGGLRATGGTVQKSPHGKGDDPEPCTDTVTITGRIEWVEAWESYPPTPGEMRKKIGLALCEEADALRGNVLLTDADVEAVWAIVAKALHRPKAA